MSLYCPKCKSEFEDKVLICPQDKTSLEKKLPKTPISKNQAIYRAANIIELERIIDILMEKGIPAQEEITGISQIPVVTNTQFVIEVPEKDVRKAKDIIKQAIQDGIIDDVGSFV